MANVTQTITKYATRALDTVLASNSVTAVLENGNKYINLDFKEAGYVKIADILMDGLSDYYRANTKSADSGRTNYNADGVHGDGYKVGNASITWTIYKLRYDRGKQFQIDEMDNEETAGLMIANIVKEFLRTQVVPEVDAVRFATITENTFVSLGNKVTETPVTTAGDANEITHCFNRGINWLKSHEVPEEDQVIFVSPDVETTIANSEEIKKYLSQIDYRSERGVDFKYQAYNRKPLISVPPSRFFDKIDVNDNGFAPATGAKALNYIIASKRCIVPVVKLEKMKIFEPSTVQNFDGYKVNIRIYHDCFIPKNKILGSYVSISTKEATSYSSVLGVALKKTSVADTYTLVAHFTQPAGKLGKVIWSNAKFTLGATATGSQLNNVIEDGADFKVTTGLASAYFALVDGSNKIIATSAQITFTNID